MAILLQEIHIQRTLQRNNKQQDPSSPSQVKNVPELGTIATGLMVLFPT